MNFKTLLIVHVLMLLNYSTKSQSTNNEKYWYYKQRFNDYFIKIGIAPGESLPIKLRAYNPLETGEDTFEIKFDDCPNDLAYYIGVLATEYALLNSENQNLDNVTYDLYCALFAINRLDMSDYCEGNKCIGNNQLDGSCLREDVPINYKPKNPPNNLTKNVISFDYDNFDINCLNALPDKGTNDLPWWPRSKTIPFENTLSVDHIIRLQMGLALVKKYVDANAKLGNQIFQDGESYLKQEAINISMRLFSYIQNGNWLLYQPGKQPGVISNVIINSMGLTSWGCLVLTTPANFECLAAFATAYSASDLYLTLGALEYDKLVPRGHNAAKYAYGLAKAAKFITGSNQFIDLVSGSATAIGIWKGFASVPVIGGLNNSSGALNMVCTLAAIGDSWHNMFRSDKTEDHLIALDSNNHHWQLFSLLWACLHDKTSSLIKSDIENMLSENICEGSHGYSNTYWCTDNRFFNEETTTNYGVAYPGLDWMLFYNLYRLKWGDQLAPYSYSKKSSNPYWINYKDNFIFNSSNSFPFLLTKNNLNTSGNNSYNLGLQTTPIEYRAEYSITDYGSYIGPGSCISYRANDFIELKALNTIVNSSNIHFQIGSEFHAYIKNSDCDLNDEYSKMDNNYTFNTINSNSTFSKKENILNTLQLYPNPTTSSLNIKVNSSSEVSGCSINVYNLSGQIVMSLYHGRLSYGENTLKFSNTFLNKGVYFVKLQSERSVTTSKLIIN
jgi:hypothetical protein